ncbi:MAG: hypothetical protein ABIG34_01320 [Candidatus Peregrinibacteria bacterium]
MPDTLVGTDISTEHPVGQQSPLLVEAEQLREDVQQGHCEQFPKLEHAIDILTQQSWFMSEDRTAQCTELYETVLRWKTIYFHLHLAEESCTELKTLEEGDDGPLWEELRQHFFELEPLHQHFTPDMEIRYRQLQVEAHVWQQINGHLYYGGEAMAIVQERFSPPDIQKLRGEVIALWESHILLNAYPLQLRRAEALRDFWVQKIRNVFAHRPPMATQQASESPSTSESAST